MLLSTGSRHHPSRGYRHWVLGFLVGSNLFAPPPPPKHPQIPFLFSPFGGYIKARRETIENTTILVVPQDPEAKTNKRVKPFPGASLQVITTFPPLHDILLYLCSKIQKIGMEPLYSPPLLNQTPLGSKLHHLVQKEIGAHMVYN
jgi:hypothetical protein